MDQNMTQSDVVASKPEPKVTNEKANEVVGPKVTALLNEVLSGFELAADDKKSRKRILKAMSEAATKLMNGQAGLTPASIGRQFSYGASRAFPPPPMTYVADDESSDEVYEGDDSDD